MWHYFRTEQIGVDRANRLHVKIRLKPFAGVYLFFKKYFFKEGR